MMPVALRTFDDFHLPLSVQVSECMACGFVFNDHVIDEQSLNQFYTKDNFYYTESSFGTGGNDLSRYATYITYLKPYIHHESIMVDVGCGKGHFVKYLIDNGFKNASGVELDTKMVEVAADQGIPVYEGSAFKLSFNTDPIDLLIYTHVFEHLQDLDDAVQQANKYLKKDGLLFIEVPNASKYSNARVFDFFWLSIAEHINHFSSYYLELLLEWHGYEIVTTSETIIPYNNPSYGYPSLKMLFRKNDLKKGLPVEIEYNELLRNRMDLYIAKENYHILKHKHLMSKLKMARTDVFIWGIGIEFFILSTFTDLLNCNIEALIDKNVDKQRMTVNGNKIVSPEHLKNAKSSSVVLLTSVFNNAKMKEYLNDISFKGSIIVIE
jgi:SAM-dependent methyltransferase